MAVNLTGYWFLDNIDLWTGFKTGIEKGTTDLLQYPPRKQSIEYNWLDQNGIDVDLSTPKYDPRIIQLQCFTITDTTALFWDNHNALINQFMIPGIHTLKITAHGLDKSYGLEYRETTNYEKAKALKLDTTIQNFHRFSLVVREPTPSIGATTSRIIETAGRYLVT